MAMAMRDSVTVSMAEESSGVLSVMSRVSWVCVKGEGFGQVFGKHNVPMRLTGREYKSRRDKRLKSIVTEGLRTLSN
jgi:hypothetical protein